MKTYYYIARYKERGALTERYVGDGVTREYFPGEPIKEIKKRLARAYRTAVSRISLRVEVS
jgi:hypothetical protein